MPVVEGSHWVFVVQVAPVGLSAGVQVPFEQIEFGGQLKHWLPKFPHAAGEFPIWQKPFRQQPGQFAGEHDGPASIRVQAPPEQTEPPGQLTHWLPNAPHAIVELPGRQAPFWQHPAQFAGEHAGGAEQLPFRQLQPLGQLKHWLPNAPHENVELPGWQTPF